MGRTLLVVTLALVLSVDAAAWAQPLRKAGVGDRMGSLVVGLTQIALETGVCKTPQGAVPVRLAGYIVPGREANKDNASAVAVVLETGRMVVLATFDEANLDEPVTIYADKDGRGLVTNLWPVADAPSPCDIIRDLRDHSAQTVH
jgi:hypothetical protein